ncbi:MAG: TetR/AcrR family transcriptional regulator [Pseudomonadota bacterium]
MELTETPAERRRHRVRARILKAAERVFAEEGNEGLSIRRLADEIDYSPAAIYKYFESKETLVDELKESFFERLLQNVHTSVDASTPFEERARKCVAAYIRTAVEKPHHYAAAFSGPFRSEGPTEGDPGFETTQKGQAFVVLSGMVNEGIQSGAFRHELDASLTAKSLWASMHGLAMMILHMPSYPSFRVDQYGMSRDVFINFHADNLVRGLEANQ